MFPCFSWSTAFADEGYDSTYTAELHVSSRDILTALNPTQTAPNINQKTRISISDTPWCLIHIYLISTLKACVQVWVAEPQIKGKIKVELTSYWKYDNYWIVNQTKKETHGHNLNRKKKKKKRVSAPLLYPLGCGFVSPYSNLYSLIL